MKQKRAAGRSGWAQSISFNATESRFMQIDKRVAPPPGAYTPKTALTDSLKSQNVRGGPFGSKSKVKTVKLMCLLQPVTFFVLLNCSALKSKKKEIKMGEERVLLMIPSP